MRVVDLAPMQSVLASRCYEAKAVLNQHGIIFLPASQQHRDRKAEKISYEDNYQGSALAAMLYPKRIEIRYHAAFTDEVVADILTELGSQPELWFMLNWDATYQGRPVNVSRFAMIESHLRCLLDSVRPELQLILDQAFPEGGYSHLQILIDAGEYGVALEDSCAHLAEFDIEIAANDACRIRALADAMQLDADRLLDGVRVATETSPD